MLSNKAGFICALVLFFLNIALVGVNNKLLGLKEFHTQAVPPAIKPVQVCPPTDNLQPDVPVLSVGSDFDQQNLRTQLRDLAIAEFLITRESSRNMAVTFSISFSQLPIVITRLDNVFVNFSVLEFFWSTDKNPEMATIKFVLERSA